MAVVYLHKRKDNNQVFYVGIGTKQSRAYEFNPKRRNYLWNKIYKDYGVIVEVTHKDICWDEACVIEKYLIDFYNSYINYNLCNLTLGGEGLLGYRVSEDRKIFYSLLYKGKKRSEEDKAKMRKPKCNGTNSLKGKKLSEEHRIKLSLAKTGKKRKPLSEEHKQKVSLARLGIVFNQEHKDRISEAGKGRIVSEETRKKMSISHLAKKMNQC